MTSYGFGTLKLKKCLSKETQQEYLKRYKNGESELRNVIVEHNLRLVSLLANSYYNDGLNDLDDIFEIGVIGLLKAIDSYDPDNEKGVLFNSYAGRCISNEINMFIRKKIRNADKCFSYDSMLTSKSNEDTGSTFEVFLMDDVDLEGDYEDKNVRNIIRHMIENISNERDKAILKMFYGFDSKTLTQCEIAEILGLSQSFVSKILKNNTRQIAKELLRIDAIDLSDSRLKELGIKKEEVMKRTRVMM